MSVSKKTLLALVSTIALVACTPQVVNTLTEDSSAQNTPTANQDAQPATNKNTQAQPPTTTTSEDQATTQSPGTYTEYSEQALTAATQNGSKAVLFFHAKWCPTCKAAEADINANMDQLPDGVTVLKVDYDDSEYLQQKYGVTYQHTFVQVDSDGEMITKWNGGGVKEIGENTL